MDTKNIVNISSISDNTSMADTFRLSCQVDQASKQVTTLKGQVFCRLRTELRTITSDHIKGKDIKTLSDNDREQIGAAFLFSCKQAREANAGLEVENKKKATFYTAQSDLKRGLLSGVLSLDDLLAGQIGQSQIKTLLKEKEEADKADSEQAMIEQHMKDKGLSSVNGGKPAGTQDNSDASAAAAATPATMFNDPAVQKAFDDLVAKMKQLESLGEARNNKGKTAASKLVTLIETADETAESVMKGFATAMEAIAKAS